MPARNIHYYLIKAARISGWLLLLLLLLYLVTGFALCGEYRVNRLIDYQSALDVHKWFEWPLIVTFVVHSSTTIYFAMRRWKWIGKRTKT